jgi:1-acyl-sn-glycerol-3-phosphate acyltransferase
MRQAKRRVRAPEKVRRADEAARAVDEFQAELARLDRALEDAIRSGDAVRSASGMVDRWLARLGLPDLATFLDRFDRVRGSERVDEFGLDLEFEKMVEPLFVFLYRQWWRVEVRGIDKVPAEGGALLVANHGGAMFPYDGAMLKVALRLDHPAARELRPLVDDFVFQAPFLASLMTRVGGVRASPENAERLLRRGELVGVFPEGVRGMKKRFNERYQLRRFGRGGFVSLALRTGAPIVPVAIVGAEEIHPLLGTWQWPAKLLGLPYFPLTPTFPWLGLLGLMPLPSKWVIHFGEPTHLARRYSVRDASDPVLVDALTEEVRETIQTMLEETLRERGPAFF